MNVKPGASLRSETSIFWTIYFYISFLFLGAFYAMPIVLPLALLARIFPRFRPLAHWALSWGTGLFLKLQPWLRVEFRRPAGARSLGPGPTLFVANHRSILDGFLMLTLIPGVSMLAKRSLFNLPMLGIMMRATGQIPAVKGDLNSLLRAREICAKKLNGGGKVLVFPELTRCPPGHPASKDFSSLPFTLVGGTSCTLVPIVIHGSDRAWFPATSKVARRAHVTIQELDPIVITDAASKDLARTAKESIDREWFLREAFSGRDLNQ